MTDSLQSKIIAGFILLVACFSIGYFFTLPQWDKYSASRVTLSAQLAEAVKLNEELSKADSFVNSYTAQSADSMTVNLALPSKTADLPNTVQNIFDLAKLSGMTLMDAQIDEAASANEKAIPDNTIQTQKITMLVSGTYASFRDFVLRLEKSLRLIDVDHITAKSDENGILQYQINLRTYYQK